MSDELELTREERKKRMEERRLRRRKRLDQELSTRIAAAILVLGLLISILLLVLPRPTESQLEKRPLATIPKFTTEGFLHGEFTRGITTAYDDTIPYRDTFKNINNSMKNLFGLHTENTVEIIGNVNKVEETPAAEPEETAAAAQPADTAAVDTAPETAAPELLRIPQPKPPLYLMSPETRLPPRPPRNRLLLPKRKITRNRRRTAPLTTAS